MPRTKQMGACYKNGNNVIRFVIKLLQCVHPLLLGSNPKILTASTSFTSIGYVDISISNFTAKRAYLQFILSLMIRLGVFFIQQGTYKV